MTALRMATVLAVTLGTAAADPAPPSDPAPAAPLVLSPLMLFDVPTPTAVPSLRLEAARVASEQFATSWRYPEPGPLLGLEGGAWFVGQGHYWPRSRRSAALHGGSVAATLLGEILLSADSPVAGVGALLTGATLDAAAADADRDAEARR
jgi:hypothetical protein